MTYIGSFLFFCPHIDSDEPFSLSCRFVFLSLFHYLRSISHLWHPARFIGHLSPSSSQSWQWPWWCCWRPWPLFPDRNGMTRTSVMESQQWGLSWTQPGHSYNFFIVKESMYPIKKTLCLWLRMIPFSRRFHYYFLTFQLIAVVFYKYSIFFSTFLT